MVAISRDALNSNQYVDQFAWPKHPKTIIMKKNNSALKQYLNFQSKFKQCFFLIVIVIYIKDDFMVLQLMKSMQDLCFLLIVFLPTRIDTRRENL